MVSFCWVYKKKGKKIFSGSVCPLGIGYNFEFSVSENKRFEKILSENFCYFLNLTFLNYENGKGFFLSWGHFDIDYRNPDLKVILLGTIFRLELGLNILEIHDRRKKNIDR